MSTPRIALIVAGYYPAIVNGLLDGARAELREGGVAEADITVIEVPGAFEIPQAARRAAATGAFDAIVGIGCLIKGDTMHFEYLATAVSTGLMDAAHATDVPMAFGVLTTLDEEQAVARSAAGTGNKGREAAHAALAMAALFRTLGPGRRA